MDARAPDSGFRRELGLIDAAVVVAGAIIGVGIFANPAAVARVLGDPTMIVGAWAIGGALALLGGFAYAELAARRPVVGGQYVYLADAYHPVVGFLYGVALLFIINGGSVAAVAILVGLTVGALFVFRRRGEPAPQFAAMPGHPVTTALFVLAAAGIVGNCFFAYGRQSLVGSAILLLAAGTYCLFVRPNRSRRA